MFGLFQELASMLASVLSESTIEYNVLTIELIKQYRVIPIKIENGILYIATMEPNNTYISSAITFHTGLKIYPIPIDENQLNHLINKYCDNITTRSSHSSSPKISQSDDTYDETLINFVNQIIETGIKLSASDIHIEPYENLCRIRYRCDGILYDKLSLTNEHALRIIARLKVLAKLDITEHRFPQDSRFQYHTVDIRINSCPTLFGEKIVLRLLNSNKTILSISSLGFSEVQKKIFLHNITKPHGMIIVTGPTSSGKTSTLYAALNHLNIAEKNITTIEDPIEIQLAGINQMSVQPKINLDFSLLLRAIMRQDPDIIMIGEIRDKDTASIAIQAATTGHLVLTSLHTNSAADTILRLISLGIPPLHITNSVSLVIAQRLIRRLCQYCKQLNSQNTYTAKGCQHCSNGYFGRTGIFELLPIDEKIANYILLDTDSISIKNSMKENGYDLLYQSAYKKVLEGVTSLDEINRIITRT
jgi:type IV pilus assembly protein PilB